MNGMQNLKVPMETLMEVISLQLANGGKALLAVTGNSMEPMLRHHRDSVMLVPAEGRQEKGTVILYRRDNGKYVLHRIIALTEDGYICCGDNQKEKEAVSSNQQIAAVASFIRKGKHVSVENKMYRLYTFLWTEAFFLRPGYIAVRRALGRIYRKLRRISRVQKSQQEVK